MPQSELRSEHSCRNWVTRQSQVVLNVQFISKVHYYTIDGLDVCDEIKRWRITYKLEPNRCTAAKRWARCQRQLDAAWLYRGHILMSGYCEGWVAFKKQKGADGSLVNVHTQLYIIWVKFTSLTSVMWSDMTPLRSLGYNTWKMSSQVVLWSTTFYINYLTTAMHNVCAQLLVACLLWSKSSSSSLFDHSFIWEFLMYLSIFIGRVL